MKHFLAETSRTDLDPDPVIVIDGQFYVVKRSGSPMISESELIMVPVPLSNGKVGRTHTTISRSDLQNALESGEAVEVGLSLGVRRCAGAVEEALKHELLVSEVWVD